MQASLNLEHGGDGLRRLEIHFKAPYNGSRRLDMAWGGWVTRSYSQVPFMLGAEAQCLAVRMQGCEVRTCSMGGMGDPQP